MEGNCARQVDFPIMKALQIMCCHKNCTNAAQTSKGRLYCSTHSCVHGSSALPDEQVEINRLQDRRKAACQARRNSSTSQSSSGALRQSNHLMAQKGDTTQHLQPEDFVGRRSGSQRSRSSQSRSSSDDLGACEQVDATDDGSRWDQLRRSSRPRKIRKLASANSHTAQVDQDAAFRQSVQNALRTRDNQKETSTKIASKAGHAAQISQQDLSELPTTTPLRAASMPDMHPLGMTPNTSEKVALSALADLMHVAIFDQEQATVKPINTRTGDLPSISHCSSKPDAPPSPTTSHKALSPVKPAEMFHGDNDSHDASGNMDAQQTKPPATRSGSCTILSSSFGLEQQSAVAPLPRPVSASAALSNLRPAGSLLRPAVLNPAVDVLSSITACLRKEVRCMQSQQVRQDSQVVQLQRRSFAMAAGEMQQPLNPGNSSPRKPLQARHPNIQPPSLANCEETTNVIHSEACRVNTSTKMHHADKAMPNHMDSKRSQSAPFNDQENIAPAGCKEMLHKAKAKLVQAKADFKMIKANSALKQQQEVLLTDKRQLEGDVHVLRLRKVQLEADVSKLEARKLAACEHADVVQKAVQRAISEQVSVRAVHLEKQMHQQLQAHKVALKANMQRVLTSRVTQMQKAHEHQLRQINVSWEKLMAERQELEQQRCLLQTKSAWRLDR